LLEQLLFGQPVLGEAQGIVWRVNRHLVSDILQRFDGDVLELVRQDIAFLGQYGQCDAIIERCLNDRACLGGGWRIGRIQEVALMPELAGCKSEHLAELPGPYNADAHSLASGVGVGENLVSLILPKLVERVGNGFVIVGNDGSREQCGVRSPGLADGHCADRDTGRHLGDR